MNIFLIIFGIICLVACYFQGRETEKKILTGKIELYFSESEANLAHFSYGWYCCIQLLPPIIGASFVLVLTIGAPIAVLLNFTSQGIVEIPATLLKGFSGIVCGLSFFSALSCMLRYSDHGETILEPAKNLFLDICMLRILRRSYWETKISKTNSN